jgi:NADP-dependent aldehyde dehydrogenase
MTILTREMFIGFDAVRGSEGVQLPFDPTRDQAIAEPSFGLGGSLEVERAAKLAEEAFDPYRNLPLEKRASFLDAIADKARPLPTP